MEAFSVNAVPGDLDPTKRKIYQIAWIVVLILGVCLLPVGLYLFIGVPNSLSAQFMQTGDMSGIMSSSLSGFGVMAVSFFAIAISPRIRALSLRGTMASNDYRPVPANWNGGLDPVSPQPGSIMGTTTSPTTIIKVKCPKCGNFNEQTAIFCSKCGIQL